MSNDDSGCIAEQRLADHFPGVDFGAVNRAEEQLPILDQPMAGVQEGRGKDLALQPSQLCLELGPRIPRIGERGLAFDFLVEEYPRGLEDLVRASGFVASRVTADEQWLVAA